MDRQTLLVGVSVFILLAFAGFYLGTGQDSPSGPGSDTKFSTLMNTTVDDDDEIATARFDNRTLDLMYEDTEEARFYIDIDRDGSFDKEFDGLKHNGEVYNVTETVNLGESTYMLYFRYKDSGNETGDGWLWLYRVREL